MTDRQIDVLKRLSEGQSNKTIARDLDLSEKTVKVHVTAIFRALNVINRTQAAAAGRGAASFERPGSLVDASPRCADPTRLTIAALSLLLETGLWRSKRPLACASAKRSGAVSPVISMAGMDWLNSERSRSIAPRPFSSPRRR